MKYRYPFTPYPYGWYRIDTHRPKIFVFGRECFIQPLNKNRYILIEVKNKKRFFPVVKKNGYTFAFFSEEESTVPFDIANIPEFKSKQWLPPFHLKWKRVKVHIQEVAENALDLSHFCVVHRYQTFPVLEHFQIFDHQFHVIMHSNKKVFGVVAHTKMEITYFGMGIVVANVYTSTQIALTVLLTTTPIDQFTVDIQMAVAIQRKGMLKDLLLKYFILREIKNEFSRDIPVWEAKIYRQKPLLCPAEANIVRIRKWAKQFYR